MEPRPLDAADQLFLDTQANRFDYAPDTISAWNQRLNRIAAKQSGQPVPLPNEDQVALGGPKPLSQEDSDFLHGAETTVEDLYNQHVKPAADAVVNYFGNYAKQQMELRQQEGIAAALKNQVLAAPQGFAKGFQEGFGEAPLTEPVTPSIQAASKDLEDLGFTEPFKRGLTGLLLQGGDAAARTFSGTLYGIAGAAKNAYAQFDPDPTRQEQFGNDITNYIISKGGEVGTAVHGPEFSLDVTPRQLGVKPSALDEAFDATRAPEVPKPVAEVQPTPPVTPASPPGSTPPAPVAEAPLPQPELPRPLLPVETPAKPQAPVTPEQLTKGFEKIAVPELSAKVGVPGGEVDPALLAAQKRMRREVDVLGQEEGTPTLRVVPQEPGVPTSAFRADAEAAYKRLSRKVVGLEPFERLAPGWDRGLELKGAQGADATRINKYLDQQFAKPTEQLVYSNGKWKVRSEEASRAPTILPSGGGKGVPRLDDLVEAMESELGIKDAEGLIRTAIENPDFNIARTIMATQGVERKARGLMPRAQNIARQFQSYVKRARIEEAQRLPGFERAQGLAPDDSQFMNFDGTKNLRGHLDAIGAAIHEIQDQMGTSVKTRFVVNNDMPELGFSTTDRFRDTGKVVDHEIKVSPNKMVDERDLYATVAHEFGHLLWHDKLEFAPARVQLEIANAYEKFRESIARRPVEEKTFGNLLRIRDNAINQLFHPTPEQTAPIRLSDLAPEERQYWLGKDEWWAEQVAKWMTTDKKPITVLDKYANGIAKKIIQLHLYFEKKFGFVSTPTDAVRGFLDALMHQPDSVTLAAERRFVEQTTAANRSATREIAKDFPATEMTVASVPQRKMLVETYGAASKMPPSVRAAPAIADKWYKTWKYWRGVQQVADANLHIRPLNVYRNMVALMHDSAARMMVKAEVLNNALLKMNSKERTAFNEAFIDYIEMKWLPEAEREAGVERRPTMEELRDLFDRHGMNDKTIDLFAKTVKSYDDHMAGVMNVAKEEINRTFDAERAAAAGNNAKIIEIEMRREAALKGLDEAQARYLQKPYAPAMRYGDYGLQIRDPSGAQVAFYRVETKSELNRLIKNWREEARRQGWDPDYSVHDVEMPKSMAPFMNLPPHLMELLEKRLSLSPEQLKILQMLKLEVAPVSSFAHRFQKRNLVPGYSTDFVRAYSHYHFHGARYLARAKYMPQLEQAIFDLDKSISDLPQGASRKRSQIANYVKDHYRVMADPSADWGIMNAAAFHYFIGPRLAALALNLTQTFTSTGPRLGAEFGDIAAARAITDAALNWNNYWREAGRGPSDAALARAVKEGIEGGELKSGLAGTLATQSEGRNWVRNFGFTPFDKFMNNALWLSGKGFDLSEQANRHVAYIASWKLAMKSPNAKVVREAVMALPETYKTLKTAGLPENEARAITTAKWLTRSTQGEYAQYARPAIMRGFGKTAFVFGTFKQQMLTNMWNFKDAGLRSLLAFGFLGGAFGIPFADDIKGIIKALAWHLMGKDFDVERESRKYIQKTLGDPNSSDTIATYGPGILTRGISKYGFGIPQVLDTIGEWSGAEGLQHFPNIDMSQQVGLGQFLPLDVGEAFGPTSDVNRAIAQQGARSFGAWGSFLYSGLKFAMEGKGDWKSWEPIEPAVVRDWSKALRIATSGKEVNRLGDTVLSFDMSDPDQRNEVIAMALGFHPTRLTETYNRMGEQYDAGNFWLARQQEILTDLWQSKDDPVEFAKARQAVNGFNASLSKETAPLRITNQMIKDSFKTRGRNRMLREKGMPVNKKLGPLYREIQSRYPDAEIGVEKEK